MKKNKDLFLSIFTLNAYALNVILSSFSM